MIRLLCHDDSVHREDDGAIRFDDLAANVKAKFGGTSQWSIEAWVAFLAKGGGPKKRFQYCLNPKSSKHFQGHSGGTLVDPTLQDNVLLPDDFAKCIYHIGNAHDMHSIIWCGLTPGGKSLKRDRQSVFYTAANPMYAIQDLEEVQYDLHQPRITVCKNTRRIHQNTVYWCNLKLAHRNGLQFDQTRSHAIALVNTLPAICIEKVVYMKTGDDWNCKVHQSPRWPRVVLARNSQKGRQDPPDPQAHQSEQSVKYRETCRSLLEDTRRKHPVTLIAEFQVFLTQPFKKKTRIARNLSKDWLNSSRTTRTGTRRSIRSAKGRRSWSPAWATRNTSSFARPLLIALCMGKRALSTAQTRYDVLSMPGYVIKKNPTHGARHGPSVQQFMHYRAHDMLRQARKHKSERDTHWERLPASAVTTQQASKIFTKQPLLSLSSSSQN